MKKNNNLDCFIRYYFFIFLIINIYNINSTQAQIIVIDPGHGYNTSCVPTCDGQVRTVTEIETNVAVGLKLKNLIESNCTWTVHMTVPDNSCGSCIGINARCAMANSWNADRLLSIHCNATVPPGLGNGTETFWTTLYKDKSSDYSIDEAMAREVHARMVQYGEWHDRYIGEDYPYLPIHLGILNYTVAPACLNEIGFVDVPSNATKLLDNTWRDKFANAYYVALQNHLGNPCRGGATTPPNDNPCDAGVPTLNVGTSCSFTQGTNLGATNSSVPNLTSCDGTSNGDLWYKFVVPASGHVIINSNAGTISDMGMALYTGSSCNSLSYYGCYPNGSTYSQYMPYADVTGLTPNTTMWIRIWEFNNNNFGTFSICVTNPSSTLQPDLIVQSAQITPSTVVMGQQVTATCYNKNQGNGNASYSSVTSLWLSADESFGGDTYLGEISVPTLNANTTSNLLSQQINIPLGPYAGTWYIMFGADAMEDNNESSEGNNQVFVPITFYYTISTSSEPSSGGTTSGSGKYQNGESCSIIASANSGYTFSNWTEDGIPVSTNSTYNFTVWTNRVFVANFTQNTVNYNITTSTSPAAGGTTSGGGTYQSGQSRTVTATANNGYTFTNWTENGSPVSTNASYTFTLSGNRTLVANFIQNTSCSPPIASVNSPSGSSPLTMTCTASGGSGGTISYKWYGGTSCSETFLGTGSTLAVTASGYYSCKAYIVGNESTCYNCAYGYATLNSSQEKTICSWSYKSNMPVGRYSSASATYGNHIYIIGGNSSKSFYQYDVINDNFITKTQIPVGGTDESQGAVLGNKIYLCHGFSDENVRIYDISTDTWATKSKRPIGSYGRGAVFKAVNNYLYAIGGGDVDLNPSSQLDKYDPVNDAWSTINNPMPTARCFASAVVHNNMIYVIGGRTTSGVSNVVEVYDPKSNTWSTKSPMPLKRNTAVAEVINNKIYVIGGFTGSTYSNSIQEYNITTDSWNTVNLAPSFINVVDAVSGVVNDKIYVIGGSNSSGTLASTEELTLCAVESCTTPGTPVSVTGTSTGQTTANLSWSAGNPAGSPTVTYYWVVGTSSSVTYGNGVAQNTTTGTSVSTSTLTPGTSYYLRVYAKTSCNETSSGYNTSTSFTTASVAILPTLTTTAPIATSVTTALSGGNIASDGGSPITAKGVCWGLSINPTILNSKSIDGSGNGSFSSNISGLTPNTTYHVRAYATNSQGTGYGSDIQFTTIPSAPIIGSIIQPNCTQSYGSVILNGLPPDGTWTIIQAPGGTTITGSGSNTTISGLDPGNYTFQVTNAAGSTSGSSANIMIAAQVMMPTVVTSSVFDATQSTVSSGGNVTSDGGATVTARGLCWSTTSNPTILNSKTSDGLSIGTFTSTITGLTNGVIYHIRAYATNCKGTAYGLDIQYMHNSTSILEIQNDEVSVFPNPVSGMLNIVYKSDNFETIKILNSQGKLILKGKVIKPSQQLDFSIYDSGLYILEFIKKTNEVKRIKVIKH